MKQKWVLTTKMFECEICDKKCSTKQALLAHMRMRHRNQPEYRVFLLEEVRKALGRVNHDLEGVKKLVEGYGSTEDIKS